jgi:hypothetical protein
MPIITGLDMEPRCLYSVSMKWLIVPIILALQGCAYTAVSTGVYIATGKSTGDHAATLVSGADCNATRLALGRQDYWCERPREPGTTYNRNPY